MDPTPISMPALVAHRATVHSSETILRAKDRGIWKSVTWAQLDARVSEIGTALLAADFTRGDVAAILSATRTEAVYADLAIQGCGAASLAIDPDEDPERVCHKLSTSGSRLAFVENEEQLDKLLPIRERCPALSRIVVFDMKGLRDFADASCIGIGRFVKTSHVADWTKAVRAIEADQPAAVHFPSDERYGMGRALTHGDLRHLVGVARARLPIHAHEERLAVLRLSDITERIWGLYLALETRCISNYPEGPDTLVENLQESQPAILGSDAAVWNHLHELATVQAKSATSVQRVAYQWALRACRVGGQKARLADLLILRAVRRRFGLNRLRLAYVGGISAGPAALDWARSLGIAIQRIDEAGEGSEWFDKR